MHLNPALVINILNSTSLTDVTVQFACEFIRNIMIEGKNYLFFNNCYNYFLFYYN